MTLQLRDYHGHPYDLVTAEKAGRRFDEQIEAIMPHGGCGQTFTMGPADQPTLRIAIDTSTTRDLIIEYATTGRRPSGVSWTGEDAPGPYD
ncbi:hypothetical protein ABT336_06815 [Micromonospora sp. NPDC000207]|uniref:hypothetical protein n=1 Tax=Micromonospora sp. NPDC000207 TaxID=3154246 RepID=UPI003319A1A3